MRRILLLTVLVIALLSISAAHADFRLVRKIPAPNGCGGELLKITGLAERNPQVGPRRLFVTSQCDMFMARSFLHIVEPADGYIIRGDEFGLAPPDCDAEGPHLSSGDFQDIGDYWLTDECGDIMFARWTPDTLYIQDSFHPSGVDLPVGIVQRNDTLWVADRESDVLHIMGTDGTLYSTVPISFAYSLSSLDIYGSNLFVASSADSTKIFEMTTAGAYVDTHYVDGLAGLYPQSIGFVGDELYVGGTQDSIRVFEFLQTYEEPVEPGDSVTVILIPDEMAIDFSSINDSGYVEALKYSTQPCPPPEGVEFFSKFYEITTTSSLDYINEVTIVDTAMAGGTPTDLVRVFMRPSGGCGVWRDITTDTLEVIPTLKIQARTRSEDDEFSVFVLGIDNRDQYDVVRDKYRDLEGHITSAEDSIPLHAYDDMMTLLVGSHDDFNAGHYESAAAKADSIAKIARATSQIPHTYYPWDPGKNVAGRIITRARTLAFSYRFYPRWLAGVDATGSAREPELSVGPNPTGGSIRVRFSPAAAGRVEVAVYSVRGKRVKTLYGGPASRAPVALEWDGANERGEKAAAGMYFVVARQGDKTAVAKVVLQR